MHRDEWMQGGTSGLNFRISGSQHDRMRGKELCVKGRGQEAAGEPVGREQMEQKKWKGAFIAAMNCE